MNNNKYNIKYFLDNKLKETISTFKNTSLDDNGNRQDEYLCQDTSLKVYDFDKYVKDNIPAPLPASPDAIYIGNKKFYFVEFKNSIPSEINTQKIKSKFKSGTKILKDLLKGFTPRDNEFIFCIVYKPSGKQPLFDYSHIESNITKFGLEEENKELDNFYNQIITEDVDFYKKEFQELNC